jgi:hypothetical protein
MSSAKTEKWVGRSRRAWAALVPLVIAAGGAARMFGYPVPGDEALEGALAAIGEGLPLIVQTVALGAAGVTGLWSLIRPDNPRTRRPARLRAVPKFPAPVVAIVESWAPRRPGRK